jgi:hypothetical protein
MSYIIKIVDDETGEIVRSFERESKRADYWIIEYENGDLKVMRHPPRDPPLYKSITPVVAIGATP